MVEPYRLWLLICCIIADDFFNSTIVSSITAHFKHNEDTTQINNK